MLMELHWLQAKPSVNTLSTYAYLNFRPGCPRLNMSPKLGVMLLCAMVS